MVENITFDYKNALPFVEKEISELEREVKKIHDLLHQKSGTICNYTGWIDLPEQFNRQEIEKIKETARNIREDCDAFIVIGVGGSYMGARAVIEMLLPAFYNQLPRQKRQSPEIYFVGHHMSSDYLSDLLELLKDKDICINVISKSGTTTEPAIAFRVLRSFLEKKYGKEKTAKRIVVTTDRAKGALKQMADENGYQRFIIPDDIGGRYSVLTAVGLLPIAVAGINIEQLLAGARDARQEYLEPELDKNPSYQYAVMRNLLYRKGKKIEILVNHHPHLQYFSEWWKQLFGESEGKDGKGIFPAALQLTTDLHSIGQYIQDGERHLYETVIHIKRPRVDLMIQRDEADVDGLNYLAGRTVDYVNQKSVQASLLAHTDGGVPSLSIGVPSLTPYYCGKMLYFFEKSCAISGYLSGVNPFDQPGVEAYKKNMFTLLGKPGYEKGKDRLKQMINRENN